MDVINEVLYRPQTATSKEVDAEGWQNPHFMKKDVKALKVQNEKTKKLKIFNILDAELENGIPSNLTNTSWNVLSEKINIRLCFLKIHTSLILTTLVLSKSTKTEEEEASRGEELSISSSALLPQVVACSRWTKKC